MYRLILFFALLCCSFVNAQNKELLYDFTDIPQALMLNPGMQTDFQWYAGIPGVSGISYQNGSSGATVNDIFADDGVDINDKVRDRLIMGMSSNDDLSGTYQVELLSGGFRGRNPTNFYSFGIYNEGDAIGYWFKDYAILGFEGNADYIGKKFNLGHLKTRGEILNVYHFGINKKINRELTVGGRAKIYSGAVNFNSTKNRGYYVTEEGENNLLANTIDADMEFRSSGIEEIYRAIDEDPDRLSGILTKRLFFGGNLGVGVDFGFSYQLNEQTVMTASVLDLGFIYNSTNVRNYTVKGKATVEGIEVILPDAFAPTDTDFWKELVDKVEALVPFNQSEQNYISFRPTKLYGSLRYNFGETMSSRDYCGCDYRYASYRGTERYVNAVGAQVYAINRPRGPQAAFTAFYMRRLGNSLALKTTYTIDKYSFSNIGLGLNVQAGPVNFYAMVDNLLAFENLADSHYTSFQLGLNIITWGKK